MHVSSPVHSEIFYLTLWLHLLLYKKKYWLTQLHKMRGIYTLSQLCTEFQKYTMRNRKCTIANRFLQVIHSSKIPLFKINPYNLIKAYNHYLHQYFMIFWNTSVKEYFQEKYTYNKMIYYNLTCRNHTEVTKSAITICKKWITLFVSNIKKCNLRIVIT